MATKNWLRRLFARTQPTDSKQPELSRQDDLSESIRSFYAPKYPGIQVVWVRKDVLAKYLTGNPEDTSAIHSSVAEEYLCIQQVDGYTIVLSREEVDSLLLEVDSKGQRALDEASHLTSHLTTLQQANLLLALHRLRP